MEFSDCKVLPKVNVIFPNNFKNHECYYPKALNAQLSKIVSTFLNLGNNRIVKRYSHLNPFVKIEKLKEILNYKPKHFYLSGGDLFYCISGGERKMILIETNSCPSGIKSMPLRKEEDDTGSYKVVIKKTFIPLLEEKLEGYTELQKNSKKEDSTFENKELGYFKKFGIAVFYDQNLMEANGYANLISTILGEKVYLIRCMHDHDEKKLLRVRKDGFLEVKIPKSIINTINLKSKIKNKNGNENKNENIKNIDEESEEDDEEEEEEEEEEKEKEKNLKNWEKFEWIPIKGCVRYITQKPWNRIPVITKTLVFNPIIADLVGGRNKIIADKAYELFNSEYSEYGFSIKTPFTVRDVKKEEIKIWVDSLGGFACIKDPYSNSGQRVWTITSKSDFDKFTDDIENNSKSQYENFLIQELIGNYHWSSSNKKTGEKLFHVGTIPNKKNQIYVADLRLIVHYDFKKGGFSPVAINGRKARKPLTQKVPKNGKSFEQLGTNLAFKKKNGEWSSDPNRLMVFGREFSEFGISLDDLIESFIQVVCANVAIDKLASKLIKNNKLDIELLKSFEKDNVLFKEIMFS